MQLQLECNITCTACTQVRSGETAVTIVIFIFNWPLRGLHASCFITVPFLLDKNKELWTELGPAVTAKIGYECNSRSVQRVLPKITSLHEVTAAGTPKYVGSDRGFDTVFSFSRKRNTAAG